MASFFQFPGINNWCSYQWRAYHRAFKHAGIHATQCVTPIPNLSYVVSYSNYIVAYVRSISGPASEKPPQDNDIVLGDSFSYESSVKTCRWRWTRNL